MRLPLIALIFLPVAAFAQAPAPAPAFVPFTVTQKDVQDIQQYFNENTPPKYSAVIIQWLNTKEQQAVAAENAATTPKIIPKPVKPVEPPKDKK